MKYFINGVGQECHGKKGDSRWNSFYQLSGDDTFYVVRKSRKLMSKDDLQKLVARTHYKNMGRGRRVSTRLEILERNK